MPEFGLHQSTIDLRGYPAPDAFKNDDWITFEVILQRLHKEGIYIHADQLAEFLLFHGLPVHLRYVPSHLQQKATLINENYRGDMAQLVDEWSDDI